MTNNETLMNVNPLVVLKIVIYVRVCLRESMSLSRDHIFDQSKVRIDRSACTVEARL